jgi:hypothetical protein
MPRKNHDLHGNVPDKIPLALLLIDVINDLSDKEVKSSEDCSRHFATAQNSVSRSCLSPPP